MATKELGFAKEYRALRLGNLVTLLAIGETPNLNTKIDFEQFPVTVHPPIFALYFTQPVISIPTKWAFAYHEVFPLPPSTNAVTILDRDGQRTIKIEAIDLPEPIAVETRTANEAPGFCVFVLVSGEGPTLILKCDALLPAIYRRAFGPATFGECRKYVDDA